MSLIDQGHRIWGEKMGNTYMLEMRNICKSFPGVKALDQMTLKAIPGRVHIIMGENGAGKSTLMKILMGIYQADAGELFWEGKPVKIESPAAAQKLGISMIHQELNTVADLEVVEYMFLGREILQKNGMFLDKQEMARLTRTHLDRLKIGYSEHTKMKDLTQSETQLCEIAKAVSCDAKLIIMDEPTSAIADREVETLFSVIRQLKAEGKAVLYITHKLNEVSAIGDDITILRDGQWIASMAIGETTDAEIIKMMIGRDLGEQYPKERVEVGDVGFEVKNLSNQNVSNISFRVRKGEIVGFSGLIGAGRTELMRAIFGLDHVDKGQVIVNGEVIKIRQPKDAIRAGVVLVPEDRKNLGLVLMHSVIKNIALPNYDIHNTFGFVRNKELNQLGNDLCSQLGIKTTSIDTTVETLSGGNQQKVVLAKWLGRDIKVLILDEPTRGIDVGAKSEIYRLMEDLAKRGICIIMISSELPEILNMSDRVYVMKAGCISGELIRSEATQEAIMRYSI